MADSFILRFCQNDIGTNLLTQSEYLADAQRLTGNQPGTARSKLNNKIMRQTALMSAGLAAWIAQNQATDVVDTLTETQIRDLYQLAFNEAFTLRLSAAQVVLSGSMMMWPASTPPAGWIKRNGVAISRSTYAALFAVLGTTFGAGDGSTTFNVPDDRASFDRGWDDSRGVDPGRVFGSTQASQNLAHNHTGSAGTTNIRGTINWRESGPVSASGSFSAADSSTNFDGGGAFTGMRGVNLNADHAHSLVINSSGGSEARPFNRAYLPIIKI